MNFIPKTIERLESSFTVPKATFIIAILTLVSRVSGLVRTRLFTTKFGAGETLDIYFAAFRIPDFIMNVLILGTLTVAFLPVFTKYLVKDKKQASDLANSVITLALFAMLAVCIIVAIFLGPLTRKIVPGFDPSEVAKVISLTRIILFAQIIFAVSNLYTVILNAHKRFLIAATAPVLYNFGIIIGLLLFYEKFGISGLGYGVILGSLLHFIIQYAQIARLGFTWKPNTNFISPGIKQVVALYIPRIFFLDLSQISLIIASFLGSFLVAGSISVFNLAFDLQAVPTGIFAISTAIAVFPVLSESFAENNHKRFWDILVKASVQILFFIVPISFGILIFRAHIVRLLFGAGNFNWEDTIATFQVLGVFTFSLFSQALIPLFSRALYARHNTLTPMIVGFISVVINIAVSYSLAPTFGIIGVAYGFTSASIINVIILYGILRRTLAKEQMHDKTLLASFDKKLYVNTGKILFAALVLAVVGFVGLRIFAPLVNTKTGFGILLQSGLSATLAGVSYFTLCYFLKIEDAQRLIGQFGLVWGKIRGKRVA